jgi:outer membrane protein assembly factor BamD
MVWKMVSQMASQMDTLAAFLRRPTGLSKGLLSVVVAFALTSGCAQSAPAAHPGTLQYTEEARASYEVALQYFEDRDWEEAEKQFNKVRSDYAQSRYARLAELRLADIKFERDQLPEAVTAYKAFAQTRRLDPGIAYAQYRVCRALYLQISDTILLPPQEERDLAQTTDAYNELARFKKENPNTDWDTEIDFMLLDVTGRLARHELYVARFYLRRDNFEAAAARARHALNSFANSGLEPEALVLLGETYLKMKKRAEAQETFERLLAAHPESPFAVPARAFLHEIATPRFAR